MVDFYQFLMIISWNSLIHMYSQRVNIPLQGLDKGVLTVGAISDPTAKLEP